MLKHFGREHFENMIYISFAEDSGNLLLRCIEKCREVPRPETIYTDIFEEYSKFVTDKFTNDENTLVIIDEIQKSQELYEMIKPFYDHLKCRMIVTGSYLHQATDFFQPVGCTNNITMFPLSFLEFLDVFEKRKELEELYEKNNFEYSDLYEKFYKLYCVVGGYPAAVLTYLEKGDIISVRATQESIIDNVLTEMSSHHENAEYRYQLRNIMQAIVSNMLQEKRGGELVADIHDFILKNYNSFKINKKELKKCIVLLATIGIFSFCDKHVFDINKDIPDERIYLNDLGILSYYLEKAMVAESDKVGLMAENFVFKTLNEPCVYHSLKETQPRFGILQDGELDFVVASYADDNLYGVEVKAGTAQANTGKQLLDNNKIDYLVVFKGILNVNVFEKIETLPIWLSPLYKYNKDNVVKKDILKELSESIEFLNIDKKNL